MIRFSALLIRLAAWQLLVDELFGHHRDQCMDKLLIINQTHVRHVVRDYVAFFNTARPHQGLHQQIPVLKANCQGNGAMRCRNVFGGIIHDYRHAVQGKLAYLRRFLRLRGEEGRQQYRVNPFAKV
jgi:hypothetical protein